MKRKKSTALFLALLMIASVFLNATPVFAENEQDVPELNQSVKKVEEVKAEDKKDNPEEVKVEEEKKDSEKTEASEELNKNDGLEISEEEVPEVVGEPAAEAFTLTKESGGTLTTVGSYNKFYDAVNAMDINDASSFFTIYVNKNATIPAEEKGGYFRTNNKFRITSGTGGPYTLKREGTWGLLGIQTDAELTVDNITLDGSGSTQCFFISNNGKVTIDKGAILQNFVDRDNEDGPAIHMTGSSTLNIEDGVVIKDNKSDQTDGYSAGVIYAAENSTVNIKGGEFKNNHSNGKDGGVIRSASNAVVNISGGIFKNNTAKRLGGVIQAYGKVNISGGTFEGNEATTGGVIYAKNASIQNTKFLTNKATWGGAVFASKKLTLNETTFNNNVANSAGGALYLQGEGDIKDSEFTGNSSESDGGTIYCKNANLNVDGCTFDNNKSNEGRGGALFLNGQNNYTIKNSTIKNNSAASIGGGITSLLGNLTVENSIIDSNKSDSLGGGLVSVAGTTINLNRCTIKNNTANGAGGAFVGTGGTEIKGTVNIKGTEFNGNDTGEGGDQTKLLGGGLYIDADTTAKISEASKFINNKSGMGGAIFDASLDYNDPADTSKYQNLNIDETTIFKGNIARVGLFAPPANYDKFTNLAFSNESDTPYNKHMSKSLLNNYDINYKGNLLITYDANGGKFEDGKTEKTETHKVNDEITIAVAPVRKGHKFAGWKGTSIGADDSSAKELMLKPGDKFKLDGNYIFVAQWEKEEPQPKPEPQPQVEEIGNGIRFNFDSKEETHITYIKGYPDNTVRPEGNITRAEAVTMLVRLKGYPIIEGQGIYKDVAKDEWYTPYIEAAYRKGILEEKEGENFRPDEKITRGELAQLISHVDKKNDAKAPFTDIEGYKYQKAIDQNYGNKRILGYPDNTFKPDAEITRAETAAMLNRLFERSVKEEGLKNVKIHEFKDLKDKNYWAYYEIIEASHTHTYTRIRQNSIEELWKTIIK